MTYNEAFVLLGFIFGIACAWAIIMGLSL